MDLITLQNKLKKKSWIFKVTLCHIKNVIMPINNIGNKHLTAAQKVTIDAALQSILTELQIVAPNYTEKERQKYGSVNEQNKLLVNKGHDFHITQPTLQSPDVDWVEFDLDYSDRAFSDTRLGTLANITRLMSDFKIAHDYDNYQDVLQDYSYSQYKQGTQSLGYAEKVKELSQFFPHSAKTNTPTTPDGGTTL